MKVVRLVTGLIGTSMKKIAVIACLGLAVSPGMSQDSRYLSDGGTNRIPCAVYPPTHSGNVDQAGLVIHLYGRGGSHIDYNMGRPPYARLRQLLAERGYWLVVPDLGPSHFMNEKAVNQLDAVIAGMKAAETIDPARVHIIGTSMGGVSGLVYVSLRPGAIRSICAIFPVTDFTVWLKESPGYEASVAQAYGLDSKALLPFLEERSPLRHADAFVHVPVFLLHGAADNLVYPHHSRDFAAALSAKGYSVTYREVSGLGHEDAVAEDYQKEIADFLTGPKDGR